MDFLIFSSSDWDGLWGSRQQVASELAQRGHRVLFVEQLAGLEHFYKYPDLRSRRRQNRPGRLRQQAENLSIFTPPLLLPGRYYTPQIAAYNCRLVAKELQPYLDRMGFNQPILWLYKPEHAPFIGRFNEKAVVYHCIDEFTVGTSGRKKAVIETLEIDLLHKADLVFANSPPTFANKHPFNPYTYRIPSAANTEHFGKAAQWDLPLPAEIADLPRPRLLFLGNVSDKIDGQLLSDIAQQRPDWSLVLVGQIHPELFDVRPLQPFPNIHLLGKRPFADVPNYLAAADICLLPYVLGAEAQYRSPLKLYEYLATGKPIVSTPHPEVAEFTDLLTMVPAAQFVPAIEAALAAETPALKETRLAAAQLHSWETRVTEMLAYLMMRLNTP